jgi:hypothetical protein
MTLRIFASLLLMVCTQSLFAQKNYSTTNAQVRFIAQDDSDIDAVNKAAVCRLQSNGDLSFIMLPKGILQRKNNQFQHGEFFKRWQIPH